MNSEYWKNCTITLIMKRVEYISHLKDELRKEGYIRDDKVIKTFSIKKEFGASDFYKNVKIWYNIQKENPNRKKNTWRYTKRFFCTV